MKMGIRLRIRFRRPILALLLGVAFCLSLSGCGEPKTFKVGILAGLDFMIGVADGFKEKLTELGYIEGKNILYDLKKSNFDKEEYQKVLKQFVAEKVDLILVFPTEASQEAKMATQGTNIPVIFSVANIEGTDLIESIREPGGNITGVRYPGPDIVIKRFEIMRELAPQAKRYWIPYQKGYPIIKSQMDALKPIAAAAGVTLFEAPAANAVELETLLQAQLKAGGMDAILFLAEPLAVTPDAFAVMGKFAIEHKIPIGGALMEVKGYGAIFGVNIDPWSTGKQAAVIADKILKGAKAGLIPVVSSENYFEINYKTAQKFGVNVSESLLSQANKIIR